ncbi:condensin-2 complex subunit H2 isoform X2 [Phycodurus eques]|uniref:condensin-2 complex subunit H2 isoform X2 n=1 Tax=Phycodurus eques TaxID=693459 RepID=UPI002ACE402E|nr:condensin-2 complex subunit H2 isoform X2 [Phycodurus eques]
MRSCNPLLAERHVTNRENGIADILCSPTLTRHLAVPLCTAAMESTASRFAHLQQPIRELSKNWDIDLAAELNDYLEELDELCLTFDEGKTKLNFAEAALLIQGSACIYSKKVEMLHNLVYQTLDYIRDRNKKQSKQAAPGDNAGRAAAHPDDDDDSFCEVDIETAEWVDRPESNVLVDVAPLPPVSLIPPESRDKNKFLLISAKGDVVCSQKDFRMNIFLPGHQDFILLTPPSITGTPFRHTGHVAGATGGYDITARGHEQSFLPADSAVEADQEVDEHIERQQAPSHGRQSRQLRQIVPEEGAPPADVWALHDQYATAEDDDKPFESGKPYKVPGGLDDNGKRKRAAARPQREDFRTWFKETYDPAERKLRKGPVCVDLNYIYRSSLKSKLGNLKRMNNKQFGVHKEVSDEDLVRSLLEPEEQERPRERTDGLGERDRLGNTRTYTQMHTRIKRACVDADDGNREQETFEAGDGGTSPEAEHLSYEDLVKLHVEEMVQRCREYTQEMALSRRVQEWEDRIRPKLLVEERRPPFDISEYGDKIVSALVAVGRRRDFASVVRGEDNVEVCKLLLASLQLANDGTVAIDSAPGLEESVDSMGLTLLSRVRAADRFKNLPALPSPDDED